MKILFHLGHPAHFHLFKNLITSLEKQKNDITIVIKKKDVLEKLLLNSNLDYINILPKGRKNNLIGLISGQLLQNIQLLKICKKNKPDLLVGTSVACAHVSCLLNIPFINVNEDDASVIPFYSYLSYPFSNVIISPVSCYNSHWEKKSVKYEGYHELAYLYPNNFSADKNVVEKYFPINKPFFLLRFAELSAHHDRGIKGINSKITEKIISLLKPYGDIYISSERKLEQKFESYRLSINPLELHHLMGFAKM